MKNMADLRYIYYIILTVLLTSCSSGNGSNDNSIDVESLGVGFNKAQGFDGTVFFVLPSNDGTGDIYIGGSFTNYNNTPVNGLVRLNSDGTVDNNFDTISAGGFGYTVKTMALATDDSGDIYVGGSFSNVNGSEIQSLVRLNSDGSIDTDFAVVIEGSFSSIETIATANDDSGDIYIGGYFDTINGNTAVNLARLNNDGSLDNSFDTTTNGILDDEIYSVTMTNDGSGDVYVGGAFTSYRGTAINRLARLSNDGSIDNGFDTVTGGGLDGNVYTIVDTDDGSGDIYVGGAFNNVYGSEFAAVVRLHSNGSIDTNFSIPFSLIFNFVYSIAVTNDSSGDIYIAGLYASSDNSIRNLARLNNDGSQDTEFDTSTGGYITAAVYSVTTIDDGSSDVYFGGSFVNYRGLGVNRFSRVNSDASLDESIITGSGFSYNVQAVAPAMDGSGDIYVGGGFGHYNGQSVWGLARLNNDGTLDYGFNTMNPSGFSDGVVQAITLANDGSGDIYVGGTFIHYNGSAVHRLVKLKSNGSIDNSFVTNIGGSVYSGDAVKSIVLANDGSGDIYVGGEFTTVNGVTVNHLVRLNSDGSIDYNFDVMSGGGFDRLILAIAPTTDGSGDIYVGGAFNSYRGTVVNRLVRLNNDGNIDYNFDTLTNGGLNVWVHDIVPLNDGSGDIYVGGSFFMVNGEIANGLVRLNDDASIDRSFHSEFGLLANSIALTHDGSEDIYVAGERSSHASLVRLNSDGSIDTEFDVTLNGTSWTTVHHVVTAVDGSNDVFAAGDFSSANETTVDNLIRLNPDGTVN